MTRYSGITNDPTRRRGEHQAAKKNVREWSQQQFPSQDAAQRWENSQPGEHEPGGNLGRGPYWGYTFLYDK